LALMIVYRKRLLAQLGIAIAAAFVIGAGASAVLTFWLGATQGANFWLVTVAITAGLLSSNLLLLGLNAVGGRIAVGIGIALLVLVSIPLSGLATAPEWLPQPWGDIGQFLPAGAGATLLRNAAFFDGHAAGMPLAVLGAWALAGLLMLGLSEGLAQPELPADSEPVLA
jgi:prepilin-type processing-associated H-X9-DG protein